MMKYDCRYDVTMPLWRRTGNYLEIESNCHWRVDNGRLHICYVSGVLDVNARSLETE